MNHLFKNPHVTALITVFFWSTTFIATKLLLIDFSPTAILFLRFIIGLVALSVLSKFSRIHYHFRQHLYLMAAGISGVCFYFFLENIALSYTSTSNVAVIVSISPLFIGLASALIYRTKLKGTFFIGFCFLLWYFSDQLCRKSFVSSLWRLFSYSSRPDVDGLFTVGQKDR